MASPVGYLQPVLDRPGQFYPNPTMTLTAEGTGFLPGDLVPFDATSWRVVEFDPTAPEVTYIPPTPGTGYGPRVEVVVTALPPTAVMATVWRTTARRRVMVRGGVGRSVVGGLVVVDPEPPLDRPMSYSTEIFDENGESLGFLKSAAITIPSEGKVWVHNVLVPSRAIVYQPLQGAFGHQVRSTPSELYTPDGGGLPRWVGGGRSGLQNIDLSGFTGTAADATALDAMLGNTYDPDDGTIPILVFRCPGTYRVPGTLIVAVDVSDAWARDAAAGGEKVTWALTGDEVSPPFPGLAEPALTWDDVAAAYPQGWSQVRARYSSWMDLARDYSLAGLAGN